MTRLAGRLVCCRRGTQGLPRCAEEKHPVRSSVGAIGARSGERSCEQLAGSLVAPRRATGCDGGRR